MSTQAVEQAVYDWQQWREGRRERVSAPHGPLALVGTYWLDDVTDGVIPGLAGHWSQQGGAVVRDLDGAATVLRPDNDPLLLPDGRKLLAIDREGLLAVRVWDPESPARKTFAGIDAFAWDGRWVVPAEFTPFEAARSVQVPNADGRERGLGLAGELTFTAGGVTHTLAVAVEDGGRLWAVLADATSGTTSFRFRFLYTEAPAADGTLTVDLNRTQLPPCAFADAFICPFPPPGNTLPYALEAGERALLTS
ncbi:DUF1684 domain-containing protein [Actinacidiphila acidipaludis]|uniref:DUF1684 domain-containing protein n=1 Tax=Actinacidiphila acidipaludis TaxID=2873382 RepID=A0ABS7Q5X5_9ACTN|nr:DUF1684 domain-containing protein [Streptomyces acidipaludis]MBY8878558.1 DUF1684 domain-containing protein [Streptomyces acidipaludis]